MGNTVIVDDFSDDIEPNINDSTSDVVKSVGVYFRNLII